MMNNRTQIGEIYAVWHIKNMTRWQSSNRNDSVITAPRGRRTLMAEYLLQHLEYAGHQASVIRLHTR